MSERTDTALRYIEITIRAMSIGLLLTAFTISTAGCESLNKQKEMTTYGHYLDWTATMHGEKPLQGAEIEERNAELRREIEQLESEIDDLE